MTSLSGNIHLEVEAIEPHECACKLSNEDPETRRETKPDGILTLSIHEDGWSTCVAIWGDGACGDDAIDNAKITCSTLSASYGIGHLKSPETCGETSTFRIAPEESNWEWESCEEFSPVNLRNVVLGISKL